MTLALLKKTSSRIFIFSDTMITDVDGVTPLSLEKGVIKTAFLTPTIAVSFSNSSETSIRDINAFSLTGIKSFAATIGYFEASSSRTNNDYLLACAHPLKAVKIEKGKSKPSIGSSEWIGDYDAFKKFRSFESGEKYDLGAPWNLTLIGLTDDAGDDLRKLTKWSDMMTAVHLARETPSVGGFMTIAHSTDGEFKLLLNSRLYYDTISNVLDPLGRQTIMATSENLSFRYGTLVPKLSGINGAGFYFPEGRLAYVYYPANGETVASHCKIYKDASSDDLLRLCEKELGIQFDIFEASVMMP